MESDICNWKVFLYAWLINTFTLSDDMTKKNKNKDNDDSLTKALAGESLTKALAVRSPGDVKTTMNNDIKVLPKFINKKS